MALEVITDVRTLMRYAKKVGDAKLSGNIGELEKAQKKLDDYKAVCLSSDKMNLGMTVGDLSSTLKGR